MLREEVDLYMGQIAMAKDNCRPACFRIQDATLPARSALSNLSRCRLETPREDALFRQDHRT
jgi:hypothetical protein